MMYVIINSGDQRSCSYFSNVAPVLEVLGADYELMDFKNTQAPGQLPDAELWLVGHPGALEGSTGLLTSLVAGVRDCGSGVVWLGSRPASIRATDSSGDEIRILTSNHFVTSEFQDGHTVRLKKPLAGSSSHLPALDELSATWQVLATMSETSVLSCAQAGKGRMVCWDSWQWLDPGILGPLSELDSLFWRSLVWAARKPFLLRSFSRTISMRVDDCIGETGHYQDQPLQWAEIANRYGFKPWLGFFSGEMSQRTVHKLNELVSAGKATAQFHGRYLFGTVYQSDCPEEVVRKDRKFFRETLGKDLPLSRYLVPHAYDLRSDLLPLVRELGSDTIGIAYPLDSGGGAERADTPWLRCGPFRRDHEGTDGIPWDGARNHASVVYSDFLKSGHSPAGDIFIYLVEPRSVNGYEWFNYSEKGECEPDQAIRNAFDIIGGSLAARLPATLFTHEDSWRGLFLANIAPDTLEKIFRVLSCLLERYDARYVTMDEVCEETRDRAGFRACSVIEEEGGIRAHLEGKASGAAFFSVFFDSENGIVERSVRAPSFSGRTAAFVEHPVQQPPGSIFGAMGAPETRETQVPLMLGSHFSVATCCCMEQVRFFRANSQEGLHVVQILDLTEGTSLGEWQHNTSESGWVVLPINSSVSLYPNHEYVVAVSTDLRGADLYPVCPWYFWRPVLSGSLRAPRQAGEQWPVQEGRTSGNESFEGYFRDVRVRPWSQVS